MDLTKKRYEELKQALTVEWSTCAEIGARMEHKTSPQAVSWQIGVFLRNGVAEMKTSPISGTELKAFYRRRQV